MKRHKHQSSLRLGHALFGRIWPYYESQVKGDTYDLTNDRRLKRLWDGKTSKLEKLINQVMWEEDSHG